MSHTPGPMEANISCDDCGGWQTPEQKVTLFCGETLVASFTTNFVEYPEKDSDIESNVRLLAAAYNSYDKHFGEGAVEAAESDLLGQALEALERLTDPDKVMIDPNSSYPSFCQHCGQDGPEKETVYDSASCEHHSVDCPYIAARRVLERKEDDA